MRSGCITAQVSSTYCFQNYGFVDEKDDMAVGCTSSIARLAIVKDTGDPIAVLVSVGSRCG